MFNNSFLQPYTYEPPKTIHRWLKILNTNWHIIPFTVIILSLNVFFFISQGVHAGTLALSVPSIVTILIAIWSSYHTGWLYYQPSYKVLGLHITFNSVKYYVPPKIMEGFLTEVINAFTKAGLSVPEKPLKGIRVFVSDKTLRHSVMKSKELIGMSHTFLRRGADIYGPYVLSHGGLGYELRLLLCEFFHPEMSEIENIEWMKEMGIL